MPTMTQTPTTLDLRAFMQSQKNAGATAAAALRNLKTTHATIPAIRMSMFTALAGTSADAQNRPEFVNYTMADVALAATEVFALTPLGLAVALKAAEYSVSDVALGVKFAFPNMAAVDVGRVLLDAQAFPQLTSGDMGSALIYAGFDQADSSAAVGQLYSVKVTFNVQANQAWQNTGITVKAGDRVSITYQGGVWTANPYTGMVDANGNPGYIAKPGYTMQGAYEGALIGQVSGNVFLVGDNGTVPQGVAGPLLLCINDDLNDQYGCGLADNSGSVTMQITEQAG